MPQHEHPAAAMSDEEFRAWNEKMSETYDPDDYHNARNPIIRWIEGSRVRRILAFLRVAKDDRVLEVGVGTGHILAKIRSDHRTGLDLSDHYLKEARGRLGPSVKLVRGNAEELKKHFRYGEFDRAYCSEVLEHVQHPDRVLEGMFHILAPGGIAVVSVPNDRLIDRLKAILVKVGIYRLFFGQIANATDNEWHLHVFAKPALLRLCRDAGFTVTACAGVPFPFLPLRYVVALRKPA